MGRLIRISPSAERGVQNLLNELLLVFPFLRVLPGKSAQYGKGVFPRSKGLLPIRKGRTETGCEKVCLRIVRTHPAALLQNFFGTRQIGFFVGGGEPGPAESGISPGRTGQLPQSVRSDEAAFRIGTVSPGVCQA